MDAQIQLKINSLGKGQGDLFCGIQDSNFPSYTSGEEYELQLFKRSFKRFYKPGVNFEIEIII